MTTNVENSLKTTLKMTTRKEKGHIKIKNNA